MTDIKEIQDIVQQWFAEESCNASPKGLYEPIDYTLSQKGKRLRPTLLAAACNLFEGDMQKVRYAALAIEIFHNFTLLHDDLMDRSPLRRGMPTVYSKWNENTAILSGDTMLSLAWRYMLKQQHERHHHILECFNETAIEICEGQQYDMDFETRDDVSIDEYMMMIRKKTDVLLAGALKIGALYANASDNDINHLYEYGIQTGLAFQLQDDLLDTFGDTAVLGKQTAQDIRDNKKNIFYLQAIKNSSPSQKATLTQIFTAKATKTEDDIQKVLDIYKELSLRSLVEGSIAQHIERARMALDAVNADAERKQPLMQILAKLSQRKK